jgi:hypothetical protein
VATVNNHPDLVCPKITQGDDILADQKYLFFVNFGQRSSRFEYCPSLKAPLATLCFSHASKISIRMTCPQIPSQISMSLISKIQRTNLRRFSLAILLSLSTLGGLTLGVAVPSLAAERVVLRYGVLEAAVSVDELATFAETGEQSRRLRRYLRLSGQDPETVRQTLNREVEVDVVVLDRVLNSFVGEYALDQLGKVIHTRSGRANRQAMRSALVLSASDDGKVSLIEVMQNYPTSDIMVDGKQLLSAYETIADLSGRVRDVLERLNVLSGFRL